MQVNHILENLSHQTSLLNKRAKDGIKGIPFISHNSTPSSRNSSYFIETEISHAKLPLSSSDRQMRQTQVMSFIFPFSMSNNNKLTYLSFSPLLIFS